MIESYTFGKIVVDGKEYHDVKIIDDVATPWQYIKHHTVIPEDVDKIFKRDPDILVIGTGESGMCKVDEEVIELANEEDVILIVEKTQDAVKSYNRFKKEGEKVDAILHSTC